MSSTGAQIAGSEALRNAADDWRAVRDTADIQFAPLPPFTPPPTPAWQKLLGEWLQSLFEPIGRFLGMSWPVFEKILIGLAVLAVLLLAWRIGAALFGLWRNRRPAAEEPWRPDEHVARALLEDADRLASEGRYGEAAHLLLQRSFGHIADSRPGWLTPASTAREMATLPLMPERARAAFAGIAGTVERSLYALRDLDAADWRTARAAYADFALADLA